MFKSTKLDSLTYVKFESLTTNGSNLEMCESPKARLMSCPRMTENSNHGSSLWLVEKHPKYLEQGRSSKQFRREKTE
jgi:hypothetical protein